MPHLPSSDSGLLLIAVDDLRPGMFVQLELGWLDHPFRRSRFQIESTAQIDTLRSLGQKHVKVRRDLSAPGSFPEKPAEVRPTATDPLPSDAGHTAHARATETQTPPSEPDVDRACERAHAQALNAWSTMATDVVRDPASGRLAAQTLAANLTTELLADGRTTLRLVGECQGSAASRHAVHVSVLSLLLAHQLGMSEPELTDLAIGALLHDVGKLALAPTGRPGEDTPHEHVIQGIRLGMAMGLEAGALRVIAQHHEHVDGSGGPRKLSASGIGLGARIVGVVDRYDRLCNPLDLSPARTPHEAQALLYAQMRTRLDQQVLTSFVKMLGIYPPGSIVELSDGAIALVMQSNAQQPLRPSLRVHRRTALRERCEGLDLAQAPELSIRRSLHAQHLPRAVLDALSPPLKASCFFVHEPVESVSTERRVAA